MGRTSAAAPSPECGRVVRALRRQMCWCSSTVGVTPCPSTSTTSLDLARWFPAIQVRSIGTGNFIIELGSRPGRPRAGDPVHDSVREGPKLRGPAKRLQTFRRWWARLQRGDTLGSASGSKVSQQPFLLNILQALGWFQAT